MKELTSVSMLVFIFSSMAAMGLSLTLAQILAPLRNARLVILSLIANFVVMPLCAVALARLLRLSEPFGVGLILLGAAGGAPFLPKLTQIARGHFAFSVALMVLLMVVTVGYLPLGLPLMLPGVSVNPAKIARSLILLMLFPLAVSLLINARFPSAAARVRGVVNGFSNLSMMVAILLLIATNFTSVIAVFGTGAILAGLIFNVAGYGVGWVLGGPACDTRVVLGLGTAQRNIAAALVVGAQSFSDANVLVMVVVVAIVGLIIFVPVAAGLARRSSPGAAVHPIG